MRAEDLMLSLEEPCLLLVPVGVVHGFSWASESKGTVITVSTDYRKRLEESDSALVGLFQAAVAILLEASESERLEISATRLKKELGWAAPGHRAAADSGLLDILVKSLRALGEQNEIHRSPPSRQAALVARFRERVDARFQLREPITVYAKALNTSQSRLRAACAVIAQQSPIQILNQRALIEARRGLLYTNLSIAEIADRFWLHDTAYFSRFFSKMTGIPPRAYRIAYISSDSLVI